jgi:Ca2+-binding RTX toxin-like protein
VDTLAFSELVDPFQPGETGVTVTLADNGQIGFVTVAGGVAQFGNPSLTTVIVEDEITNFENVTGTNGNDRITGNADHNELEGNDGDDFISGRGGNDTLIGGDGNDTMNGGEGADFFVFSQFDGGFVNTIEDYSRAEGDWIMVEGFSFEDGPSQQENTLWLGTAADGQQSVFVNVDGGAFDFEIIVQGVGSGLLQSDFIL